MNINSKVEQKIRQVDRSIRDDPYWVSEENSLERIELSSINKVSLV